MKTNLHVWSYLSHLFLEWEMFDKFCKENQNTRFVYSDFFFENLTFMS
jgi:hypothetical protein